MATTAPTFPFEPDKNKLQNWAAPIVGWDIAAGVHREVLVRGDGSLSIGGTDALQSAVVFTDTSARATGDYCGTDTAPQAFANAVRFTGGTARIRSLAITDYTQTAAVALELWLFSATFVAPVDNASWTITDAEALLCQGVIPIATGKWYASGANKVFSDDTLNLIIKPAATSLFYAIVARGTTPAWTTAAGLQLTLGVEQV